ncbi:unnamed protein product, partial [Ascophyllum nodosum]
DVEASCRTRVDCRSSDYAGYRRAKISRQTEFLCEDGGAAVLLARCCCQERGHAIFTIAIEMLMGLVRVLPCVPPE